MDSMGLYSLVVARIYWTCSLPSWPIYLLIGHVRIPLGQYICLLTCSSPSWPISPNIALPLLNYPRF